MSQPSRRAARWGELLDFSVDPDSAVPLFRQIYLELRRAILDRALPAASRLPSTRDLAARLGVSRTSVIAAYDQLLAEGYIEGRTGSGTFVSHDLPAEIERPDAVGEGAAGPPARPLSRAGQRYSAFPLAEVAPSHVPFATGCCSVDAHTVQVWRKLVHRQLANLADVHLAYSEPLGLASFRREIALYLRAARAVRCEPEQIIVVSGAQHAIDLATRVLLDPGDALWIEDPCYPPVRGAFGASGLDLVPVPVDGSGLIVSAGIAARPDAKAVYVTPSHQYPTGGVLAMSRRLELLAWARAANAWIIEDDYDSEFRYAGRALASLQGLDDDGRVIYVGTLSKVLFPGLRVGYAVIPPSLVDAFAAARFLSDRHPPTFMQELLARFMAEGFFTGHIRRMRQRYRESRDLLVDAVRTQLDGVVTVETPEGGMQLLAQLAPGIDDVAVARAARRRGVTVRPVSPMYVSAAPAPGLILGFTGFDMHRLRGAVGQLADVLSPPTR